MPSDLNKVDPRWAWEPFEPNKRHPWGLAQAAHLYRRAGFSANWFELEAAAKRTPTAIVKQWIAGGKSQPASEDASARAFYREMATLAESTLSAGDPKKLSAWWLYSMIRTPNPALEKIVLFWHGHFATSAAKVQDARAMFVQHEIFRRNAWGNFGEMVRAISRDPAMLIYLDSTTNRKTQPNENFSRELMELFCLGVGNYSEKDIQELARCFTGWEVYRGSFRFNQYQHDFEAKTFFGKTGKFDGDDGAKIVLSQSSAARFIVRKLVRYYLCDEPELPVALIEPLARELRESGFRIGPIVERMLLSNFMFSSHAIGQKIRSPVELGVGLVRSLEAKTNVSRLAEDLAKIGQAVFFPPNVKGWPGGRSWINTSNLLGRANLVRHIVFDGGTRLAGEKLDQLAARYDITTPADAVDWLLKVLVAVPLPDAVRDQLIDVGRHHKSERGLMMADIVCAIGALPEFHIS